MKPNKEERETSILWNQKDDTASVFTYDKRIIKKLKKLTVKYPDRVYEVHPERDGAVSYIVPKTCIWLHEPISDAQRKAASERQKASGARPPVKT